jgi:hypothetical protein
MLAWARAAAALGTGRYAALPVISSVAVRRSTLASAALSKARGFSSGGQGWKSGEWGPKSEGSQNSSGYPVWPWLLAGSSAVTFGYFSVLLASDETFEIPANNPSLHQLATPSVVLRRS